MQLLARLFRNEVPSLAIEGIIGLLKIVRLTGQMLSVLILEMSVGIMKLSMASSLGTVLFEDVRFMTPEFVVSPDCLQHTF
jgi:hypothetical protein